MDKVSSVTIDERASAYIEAQIAQGVYRDPSEVVHAGLRLLEERDAKIAALREALIEGEESGLAEDFDFEDFLADLRKKRPAVA